MLTVYYKPSYSLYHEITPDAQLCGLTIFVDDDMPDEYYQIGYKQQFTDYFEWKKKQGKHEGE